MFGGDFLKLEIAANAAVGVKQIAKRKRAGMKTAFAILATPGNDPHQRKKMVLQLSAPGTAIVGGSTDWAGDLQVLGKLPGTPEE
jgi:hypothetical protein